jgi:hypothetical protein
MFIKGKIVLINTSKREACLGSATTQAASQVYQSQHSFINDSQREACSLYHYNSQAGRSIA